jgi:hypothetical protein
MNRKQRLTVFFGILVTAFMVTFPPMRSPDRNFNGYGLFPGGCTYIAALDRNEVRDFGSLQSVWKADTGWRCWRVHYQKLVFQIAIACLITGAVFVLFGGKRA